MLLFREAAREPSICPGIPNPDVVVGTRGEQFAVSRREAAIVDAFVMAGLWEAASDAYTQRSCVNVVKSFAASE
jgi:hypothetical protein